MSKFMLVNDYVLFRLGAKNINDELTIIESERRNKCEVSYGYVHMIWIVKINNGSVIASVPFNTSEKVKSFLYDNIKNNDIYDDLFISPLKELAKIEAKKNFDKELRGCSSSLIFACNAETIAPLNPNVYTTKITDKNYQCFDDIHFPDHCIPDGVVYSVIENNKIVSLAHAHKTGEYQDIVADIGVDTSKEYRKKGYARECVNSVARHFIEKGGESIYTCSPDNFASIKTAISAGYEPFGKSLAFTVVLE